MPAPPRATPSRKRLALTARSHAFDGRIDAARGDLADLRLADRLFAPHYAAAVARTATIRTPILGTHGGGAVSELLQGEDFEVLEFSQGHAWGVGAVDGAVGFVLCDALGAPEGVTHIVCASKAALPMGTRLTADRAAAFDSGAIRPLAAPIADFAALAETLIGTPSIDGGRSSAGVNCSGLVFLCLSLAGIRAPRFVDLQAAQLGHVVGEDAPMLRGDLLFFADHVAIVADGDSAIHVDAKGGAVTRESIATIVDGGAFGPPIVRRRLP